MKGSSITTFGDQARAFFRLLLHKTSNQPNNVAIEITTACNFSCRMCYRHGLNLGNGHIDPDLFARINRQLPMDIRRISLSGLGEGLMNPAMTQYLEACRELHPKALLDFTTNGFLLDGQLAQDILHSPVNLISFSIDSVGTKIPSMGHPCNAHVLDNVRTFAVATRQTASPIEIRIQSVVFSEPQVRELLDFASEIKASTLNLIRMDTPASPEYQRLPIKEFRRLFQLARSQGRKTGLGVISSAYHTLPMRIASRFDKTCLQYHDFLYITIDGELTPCCVLRNYSFGNAGTEDIGVLWNSDKVKSFFQKQKQLCRKCDIWRHDYTH